MEGFLNSVVDTLEFFPKGLIYVALGLAVLVLAKTLQDLITRYSINQQVTGESNVALGLSIAGYYLGVIFVFVAALYQPLTIVRDSDWKPVGAQFWGDLLEVSIYAVAGILVLNIARIVVDRFILYNFNTEKEIIEDQNVGTGVVEFGVYLATGLVIAASIAGTGSAGGDVTNLDAALRSLAFLGLGTVILVLYVLFYQFSTPYDIHAEIEKGNVAVGVALAGNLIAIGLVTFKAVFGEFVGWPESLASFITFAVLGVVLLYLVRRITDIILLPGTKLSDELGVERNLGVAFIVTAVVISASLILYFAI